MALLQIKNLSVSVGASEILSRINFTLSAAQVMALLGPNGSGKSTLAQVLMGQPDYQINSGAIRFAQQNLLRLKPEERSRAGIFLAWQNPVAVPGLKVVDYLRGIYMNKFPTVSPVEFKKALSRPAQELGLERLLARDFNDGFSGGEKKRLEALQMAILAPKLAIIDEIDSGLDIDSLKTIQRLIKRLKRHGSAFIIISHYTKLFHGFKPGKVLIMSHGKIVKCGTSSLLKKIDQGGFNQFSLTPFRSAPESI